MNTSELNTDSDKFPAFVVKNKRADIHSDIVKSERELGEWYSNYDGCSSWFEDGTLFERNFHGRVSELCEADTEDEAYLEMAKRARKDGSVFIETERSLLSDWIDEYSERQDVVTEGWAMVEKLREVKNS